MLGSSATLPRYRGRVWGPDLFAWVYDQLVMSQGWRNRGDGEELEHNPFAIKWRDRIRDFRGWVPDDVLASIDADLERITDPDEGLLLLIIAVDRAYVGLSLIEPHITEDLAELIAVWDQTGRLELAASGAVLRKGSTWKVGTSLAHYARSLSRVRPEEAARIVVHPISATWSIGELVREKRLKEPPSATDIPSSRQDIPLKVAFLPTLLEAADLRFVPVNSGAQELFKVEHDEPTQRSLESAALALVFHLERAKVNFALTGEGIAGTPLIDALRAALRANFANVTQRGRMPNLRLLIAGAVGTSRTNEAVALGADGSVLLVQRKLHAWLLDRRQQKRYGLEKELGGPIDRKEDIKTDGFVCLLDDPGFGRLAFLICEDLARSDPARGLIVDVAPTIIVSPVLDASLERNRWSFTAGQVIAVEPGSLVLVANSFVLAQREAAAKNSILKRAGIGIVLHPTDFAQTRILRLAPTTGAVAKATFHWPIPY